MRLPLRRRTWFQWSGLAVLLCQATLVSARLQTGCTTNGTVLLTCSGVASGAQSLDLGCKGLTAIAAGAFDGVPGSVAAVYVVFLSPVLC